MRTRDHALRSRSRTILHQRIAYPERMAIDVDSAKSASCCRWRLGVCAQPRQKPVGHPPQNAALCPPAHRTGRFNRSRRSAREVIFTSRVARRPDHAASYGGIDGKQSSGVEARRPEGKFENPSAARAVTPYGEFSSRRTAGAAGTAIIPPSRTSSGSTSAANMRCCPRLERLTSASKIARRTLRFRYPRRIQSASSARRSRGPGPVRFLGTEGSSAFGAQSGTGIANKIDSSPWYGALDLRTGKRHAVRRS